METIQDLSTDPATLTEAQIDQIVEVFRKEAVNDPLNAQLIEVRLYRKMLQSIFDGDYVEMAKEINANKKKGEKDVTSSGVAKPIIRKVLGLARIDFPRSWEM